MNPVIRLSANLWPFPFGVSLGWATTRVRNPDWHTARGRVFLLRCNGAIFSGGFGSMCDRFREAGLWADDMRCVGDLWMRRRLIAANRAGDLQGPTIMVGHSCGGRYATYSAGVLGSHGVPIDLLVCIDSAWAFPIPSNVTRAVHLFRTHRRLYPARPLRSSAGSTAQLENIDLDSPQSPIDPRWINHMNITTFRRVQDWVVARVLHEVQELERAVRTQIHVQCA